MENRVTDGDAVSFPTPVHPVCETCAYRHADNPVTCEAFPNGIPMIIVLGMFDHSYSYDLNGVSDGGVIYKPKGDIKP
jgi:hypothetical protein